MSAFLGVLKNHGLPKLCTRPCLFLICTLQHQAQNSASPHRPPILSKNCARLSRLLQPPHDIQLLSRRKLSCLSYVALSVHPMLMGTTPLDKQDTFWVHEHCFWFSHLFCFTSPLFIFSILFMLWFLYMPQTSNTVFLATKLRYSLVTPAPRHLAPG